MQEFLSHIHVANPAFLFLLLLLPLFWIRWRERFWAVILWRCIVSSLLVIALADPEWISLQEVSPVTKEGDRVFAFDLSRSVPMQMRKWMERSSKEEFSPSVKDRMLVFGGDTQEVRDWEQWLRGEKSAKPIQPGRTNLEKLFSVLLGLPQKPRSVFLFTDGWENDGDLERLLPLLASSGIKVFPWVPTDRSLIANVAVKKVLAPHQATSGEEINLKVQVENQNNTAAEGSLILKRNGQPFKTVTLKVTPGSQIFTYQATLPQAAMASFEAIFVPRQRELDLFPQDNQATAWVAVRTKEKVLVLNGRSGEGKYLEEILRRRGFDVTSVTVNRTPLSPAGYGVVVFNNVERERFSRDYLAGVERHVASGNAFVMLGDQGSFEPGGYRQTPIEAILPVELREPKKEEKNRAVVFVVDKSGSMREGNKLLYATEAMKASLRQFKDGDLVGVVGFDIDAFVVVPLTPVERLRGTFGAQVDRLRPGGRTYVYPALIEAKRQLEGQDAGRKHIIVLSDGITSGAQSQYIDLVLVMKNEQRITVSVVAIGDDADIALMKRMAQYGGGFFHHAFDPATLPQIVLKQMEQGPDEKPAQRDFTPVPARGSALLEGFAERYYPPLKGFVETDLKKGAHLDIMIPQNGRTSPLLASWDYGKGKTVAFTTDLSGRWSKEWIQWTALERLWGKIFDWLRPTRESLPPHEVRINLVQNQPVLDLYLFDERPGSNAFYYSFSAKDGKKEGALRKAAPGHYQATLPISNPGDYRIELAEERQGRRVSYPPVGYTLAFDPRSELPRSEFNIPLLQQLERASGGEINAKEDEKGKNQQETTPVIQPFRAPLTWLASILFLLEVMFRNFYFRQD
jgi:Mg-chelatase subunit ChlD